MTDLQEPLNDKATSDLWTMRPDWMMLTVSAVLVIGWALWIGITAYRLLVT